MNVLFVLLSAASALAAQAPASGTIGRKGGVLTVVDAYAYEAPAFFGEGVRIRVRLSPQALDAKALAATIDVQGELDRQLEGVSQVELEFERSGAWTGGGSYTLPSGGCGWCQVGSQAGAAVTRVEAGRLKGTLKSRAADDPQGDGAEANLTLDVPIASAAEITALPANGGEPGQAYTACLAAMARKAEAGIVSSCFTPDDGWLSGQNLDYYNDAEFAERAGSMHKALRLESVTIAGGRVKGDQAELQVEGRTVSPNGAGEPPTVEKFAGQVYLRRSSGAWGYTSARLAGVY